MELFLWKFKKESTTRCTRDIQLVEQEIQVSGMWSGKEPKAERYRRNEPQYTSIGYIDMWKHKETEQQPEKISYHWVHRKPKKDV